MSIIIEFFFSSRRRHTRWPRDWSSDVCSSDLRQRGDLVHLLAERPIGKTHLQKQYQRRGAGSGCYALPVTLMPHQIGRASCREREKSAVVGEFVKENKERIESNDDCRGIYD